MEPNNPEIYDNRAEEVLDWYKHYMGIKTGDFAGLVVNHMLKNPDDVSVALERAAQDRANDVRQVMHCTHDNTTPIQLENGPDKRCDDCGHYL